MQPFRDCSLVDAGSVTALYLRTFKLMASNMMASVSWLVVMESMAVNS